MNNKLFVVLALSLLCAFNSQFSTAQAQATWTPRPASGQWDTIACSADGTKVYAVVQGGIYASTDSGVTWAGRNGSQDWDYVTCSADGTKLLASTGDYLPVFTSTDSGTNFTERSYGLETPVYSLASSADGTKLVLAASGNDIFTSTDSGATWVDQAASLGLLDNVSWSSVACSTNGTQIVATAKTAGFTLGWIYISADSGETWTPRAFTNFWQSVASSADGTKLVAAGFGGQLYTSTDSGTNWTPRAFSTNWRAVASSADGTKLVAAVYNGQIYTSTDSGTNWTAGDTNRAWRAVACSADGSKLFAVVNAGASGGLIYVSGVVIVPTLSIFNLGSSVGFPGRILQRGGRCSKIPI